MISVTRLIVLVLALAAVCLSARLAQCQSLHDNYNNNDADFYQLDADSPQLGPLASFAYKAPPASIMGPNRAAGSYYGPQEAPGNDNSEAEDDDLIGSLADELLAARRRQRANELGLTPEVDLVEAGTGGESLREDDMSALLDQLSNQKRQKGPGYYYYDINSHLPASLSSSSGSSLATVEEDEHNNDEPISGPVNDPEEFEAKLGQLTDALNHNMANTRGRQELLMGLLNRSEGLAESGTQPPVNSLSSISRLEMDRLVGELGKMLDESTKSDQDEQQQPQGFSTDGYELGSLSRYGGSEYIDHPLALAGHQYVQGGAGEGRQLLGPDGTYENVQVIKTDSAIPSYCNPPNPCPIGYTASDGCLENFVNSASFSREYQAQQKCSCDNEHSLFNCASPMSSASSPSSSSATAATATSPGGHEQQHQQQSQAKLAVDGPTSTAPSDQSTGSSSPFELGGKLDTLARTIQNRFGDLATVQRLIGKQQQKEQQEAGQTNPLLSGNDDADSNYLVRSARKLSSLDMHHKVDLD